MAGYYDDFIGARTLPDDSNTPSTEWKSSSTHHGNPINGWATLNPRYTYAWCERGGQDDVTTTLVVNWLNPPYGNLNGFYTPQSVVLRLTDATLFPTSGTGTVNGDIITWTGKGSGNELTGVTGINRYHGAGDTISVIDRFNNAVITSAYRFKHNLGIHEWLTYDANRREAGEYEGTAQY